MYHQDTDDRYGPDGRIRDFFADGHDVTTSLFVTAAMGLAHGLDTWGQVSFHDLAFDDAGGHRQKTGVGDVRLWLRASPEFLGLSGPIPIAVRAGVKLPGSTFPVDAEVIPLNDGQRDWEVMLELGSSLWPAPVYLQGWVGYRWREQNDEVLWDPGDEVFYYAAAGGELGRLTWKLASQGLFGRPPVVEGVEVANGRRKLVEVVPKAGIRVGSITLEAGMRLPVDGRNFPHGPIYLVGTFVRWSIF